MNALQKKSFELLQVFVGICEKWQIPYFLVCGSALGAVKYGGFIPWDDDIDVALLREDYHRFLTVAPQELPQWCFLQNYQTEETFPHTFSKLRNSNTAFIEEGLAGLPINHGIYLDIFPIDGHPKTRIGKAVFGIRKKVNEWIQFTVIGGASSPKVSIRNQILRLLGFHKRVTAAQMRLEKLYSSYSTKESELWCNYGNWQEALEYAPKWHYGAGTYASFEGLPVRIPENFDAYLTQKYGDWRSDPPAELQKSHHISTIIDTQKSYREYLNKN